MNDPMGGKIAAALVKAQRAFAPALKTATNPHFRSRYVALDGCVEAVIDALNENGIFLHQATDYDSAGVVVETVFIHESGESVSGGRLFVPAPKHDPQGFGSALTYARRYSLMAACGIAPEDDDGNAATAGMKSAKISDEQIKAITNSLLDLEVDHDKFLTFVSSKAGNRISSVKDIPAGLYDVAMAALKAKAKP